MNSTKLQLQQQTKDQITSQLLDRSLVYTKMPAAEFLNLREAAIETNNMDLFRHWQKGKYFDFTNN